MLRKLLIANRGEIALRIMRTCRELGIATVAVYSDADRDAPHARFADEAIRIGPPPASESYLCLPSVMEAAQEAGADALHPGYGFLSENAALPEACVAAGITFVGPPAAAMRLLGDKAAAKRVAEEHDVPVLPGIAVDGRDDAGLSAAAEDIGYPLMIKAAAGGGGRGMRLVSASQELPDALADARREVAAAFGDDRLLLERAVVGGRHIEVQVLADRVGGVIHLGERDCSIQRRHQKVIEEGSAPRLDAALRDRMWDAAVELARAVGYENAGTVEFLLDPNGDFYFLEMNARLQVEHGVTELITGLDIVALQLRIASGERLPLSQDDVRISGYAIECRVYAEEPARGYLPSSGRISYFRPPEGDGVRNDAGIEEATKVSTEYDPLLAKLLVYGESREEALGRCRRALAAYAVEGVKTNLGLLQAVVRSSAFADGGADLRTLESMSPEEFVPRPPDEALLASAVDLILPQTVAPAEPWQALGPWRVGGRRPVEFVYQGRPVMLEIEALVGRTSAWRCSIEGREHEFEAERNAANELTIISDGQERRWTAVADGRHLVVESDDELFVFGPPAGLSASAGAGAVVGHAGGALLAPMPGLVVRVLVEEGAPVVARQPLVVLEAMKMEHLIEAPADGVVRRIACRPGDRVAEGDVLVEFEDGRVGR